MLWQKFMIILQLATICIQPAASYFNFVVIKPTEHIALSRTPRHRFRQQVQVNAYEKLKLNKDDAQLTVLRSEFSFSSESRNEADPLYGASSRLVEAFESPYGVGLRALRHIDAGEPLVVLPRRNALGVHRGDSSPLASMDDEAWRLLPWCASQRAPHA